ncbi:MAG: protein-disulfide reductase DsbD family protein [Bacteroidia bacterium]
MNGFVRIFLLSVSLLVLNFHLSAQIENAVTFEHSISPSENVSVGDVVTLSITASIDPGYHMYSAKQVEKMMMVAATFDLEDEVKGVEISSPLDDKGHIETKYDDIFEGDISLYHDEVTYVQKIKITGENPTLAGYLRYQVCDDSRCIPGSYDVSIPIKTVVKKAAVKVDPPKVEKTQPQQTQTVKEEKPKEEKPVINEQPQIVSTVTPTIPNTETTTNPDDILKAVHWDVNISKQKDLKPGEEITMTFTAEIDPGFYVYSSIPPEKPAGLPTTFDLDDVSRGIQIDGKLVEKGDVIKKFDEIFETDVQIFKEKVVFTQKLKVTEANPLIEGYLSYQVCNESMCIPDKVEFFYGEKGAQQAGTSTSTDETNSQEEKESLWVLILKALALGFGSVLTPCVFPLIPLTVSFFTKQSDSRAKGIRNATFYGLSIITIYTVLGLLVAAIFGPDAMRQLSVSPGFNLLLFAALFIFGLSFLGWFDITLPASWSTAMSKGSDRGGLIGIFLMAMTLAIVSFSCTGPLVFTALADAASGSEFIRPIAAMLAFSGALALPFVFFAIFPGYMNSLPNSGGWLVSVKVVLGLLEIALAFIYLSRADLVMHLGILDREIFIGAWIVIFAILGIYLLGKLQLPHDSPVDRISVPRLLLAMTAFWFVTYLLPGLWGAPLNMLGGYIPESNNQMGVMLLEGQVVSGGNNGALEAGESDICNYPGKISEHLSEGTPRGFCAFYDLEQGLAYAKEVNKPVFLDFTGHTCANCRYLEKNAWIDNEVRNYINNEFVLISLYTDDRKKLPEVEELSDGRKLRTVGDKWIEYERTVYRQNAQPYYVLMDHDKSNLIEPTGFNPPLDVQEYRDFFKAGLEEFKQRHGL